MRHRHGLTAKTMSNKGAKNLASAFLELCVRDMKKNHEPYKKSIMRANLQLFLDLACIEMPKAKFIELIQKKS